MFNLEVLEIREFLWCALFVVSLLIVNRRGKDLIVLLIVNLALSLKLLQDPWERAVLGYYVFIAVDLVLVHFYFCSRKKVLAQALWIVPLTMLVAVKAFHVPGWIGFSYLALKMIYLGLESVRLKDEDKVSTLEGLNFLIFLPMIPMGPIFRLRDFRKALNERGPVDFSYLDRIFWGLFQWKILGATFAALGFKNYILDGYDHGFGDLMIACFASLFDIYFKFNGFMDIALGCCLLLGWKFPENFNAPFLARNMREFWNRWHISLNLFMRDIVFMPLTKYFSKTRKWKMNNSIYMSFMITFILTGVWHGFDPKYLFYGIFHGAGLCMLHMWGLHLKKRGVDLKTYEENRWILWSARALTVTFMAASMFFFWNDPPEIKNILKVLEHYYVPHG